MELTAYRSVIDQLKPLVSDPDFDEMLLNLTRSESKSVRFLIKMELKRLTTPCARVIDLRGRVDGVCRPIEHEGRLHFMDDVARRVFERAVKEYRGRYTMGVYEEVMSTENNYRVMQQRERDDKLRQLQNQETKSAEDEALLLANNQIPQYPGRLIRFGQYVGRSEERMHFSVRISVRRNDGSVVEGVTTNLSVGGLRIRMPIDAQLALGQPVMLRFLGLEQQFAFDGASNGFRYDVVARDKSQSGAVWYRLRKAFESPPFEQFLANFIQGNKRRYKVDLEHVVAAVTSKGYEQYYVPRMNGLSLFVNDNDGQLEPAVALVGEVNCHLIHYWRDEEYRLQLDSLLTPARLAWLRDNPDQAMVLYSFTHASRGRLYFYAAASHEFASDSERRLFTAFGANKSSWRCWQLHLESTSPELASISTLKQGSDDSLKLEQPPIPPRVQPLLQKISHLLLLIDASSPAAQAVWAEQVYDRGELNRLNRFVMPRQHSSKLALEALSFNELRRELRYQYRTQALGIVDGRPFEATTRDISAAGLQLELAQPQPAQLGQVILLDLPQLQGMTTKFKLKNLPYEVVGVNTTDTVYHLKISGLASRHEGYQFLNMLIQHNKAKLPQTAAPRQLAGLAQALRNLVINQRVTAPFFVHKRGARYALDSIASPSDNNPMVELLQRIGEDGQSPNLYPLVKAEALHERLLEPLKKLERSDPPLQFDIYLHLRSDGQRVTQVQCRYTDEFHSENQRRFFIDMALKRGEFYAWRLQLGRAASRPDTEFINDELTYISQYAIHRAKPLEAELWAVVGVGEVMDITAEVLARHQAVLNPEAASNVEPESP